MRGMSPMRSAIVVAAMGLVLPSAAEATEGYFQHGYGARHKALGGAGVADGRDSTAISLNPAGLVHSGNEVTAAVSAFSTRREFEGGGAPGFTPDGVVESDTNWFAVPNLAATYRLAPNPFVDVIGVSVYGSGGMNTDYPDAPGGAFSPGSGIFGFGPLGVNLEQALISVGFAKTVAPGVSVGVAPILARQQIKLRGLEAFGVNHPGTDISWGAGVRGGVEFAVAPNIRVGVAGNSPIWSEKFDRYSNLFAERGSFDIPASIQAGIAVDVTPDLTLLADYRRIWFGSIASIANPSNSPGPFGADNGPGFGWDDVDVLKLGVEWRTSPDLTLRAGYSYATNPISSRDVQLNILAPAVVQHHITAGFEYRLDNAWSVEFAGLYAPEESVVGGELVGNPDHSIEISMYQFEATLGVKYRFGAASEAPLK